MLSKIYHLFLLSIWLLLCSCIDQKAEKTDIKDGLDYAETSSANAPELVAPIGNAPDAIPTISDDKTGECTFPPCLGAIGSSFAKGGGGGSVRRIKDLCPDDPNKIDPGVCGCGVPDIDSDRDKILDCKDNCPFIANKKQNDTDLDGVGDICDIETCNDGIDNDGDGMIDEACPTYSLYGTTDLPKAATVINALKLNNDSYDDMVTISQDKKLTISINDQNGSFTNQTLDTGNVPCGLASGDLDNDGDIDLIVTNWEDNNMFIYENDGSGSFVHALTSPTGGRGPCYVDIGDFGFDDGPLPEIIVANLVSGETFFFIFDDSLSINNTLIHPYVILPLLAVGGFVPFFVIALPVVITAVVVAVVVVGVVTAVRAGQVINDTPEDEVVVKKSPNTMNVLFGTGLYNKPEDVEPGPDISFADHEIGNIFIGDVNDDDQNDIIAPCIGEACLLVALNEGDHSFTPVVIDIPMEVLRCDITDFNLDNKNDFVCSRPDALGLLYLAQADDLQYISTEVIMPGISDFSFGDFDNDGIDDLAIIDQIEDKAIVSTTNITPPGFGFSLSQTLSTGQSPCAPVLFDADGDLDLDMAVANQLDDNVSIYINDNGTFVFSSNVSVGSEPCKIVAANLDGQIGQDLVVGNALDEGNGISVLLNNGSASFSVSTYAEGDMGSGVDDIDVGDFNNDGAIDIIIANDNQYVTILENNGNGTDFSTIFSETLIPIFSGSVHSVVAGNFYNSSPPFGLLDFAVSNAGSSDFQAFKQSSVGMFDPDPMIGTGLEPVDLLLGNLSGEDNFVTVNSMGDSVDVFYGEVENNSLFTSNFSTGSGSGPNGAVIADIDNDGQNDIVVSAPATQNIALLIGVFGGTNFVLSDESLAVLTAINGVDAGDIDGDGDIDIVGTLINNTVVVFKNNLVN